MSAPCLVFVTGGVMSGLGKGITTSSIARLLACKGFEVSAMKIDPYINVDAGTMRPTEHGEVFVTADGGEIDQDLGNYERFLHKTLSKDHNLTTGKVYKKVIEKERKGDYLGKTVQIIPHLTDEIKKAIMKNAEGNDILLVEIGGTVGDYENVPFLEAARQLKLELGQRVVFVHVSFVPVPGFLGEPKTKPTQHSVKFLQQMGIQPDFLVCRSVREVDSVRRQKLALFCNVKPECVINNPDVENIYELPLVFESQGFGDAILDKLGLKPRGNQLYLWQRIVDEFRNASKEIVVGIVGKYVATGEFELKDSYISVNEAVKHACAKLGAKPVIKWINSLSENITKDLEEVDCVIVPGGFGSSGVKGKLEAIKYCRENKKPFLGLCFGMQLAVVEFARNVCGLDADSSEINPHAEHKVVDILPEQRGINEKGGTMRLGEFPAVLVKGSLVWKLYEEAGRIADGVVFERHRHRYEVNPEYHDLLESKGMLVSGKSPDGRLAEFIEVKGHPFFVATQAHPEFTSWPGKPNPLFFGLVKAGLEKENSELNDAYR